MSSPAATTPTYPEAGTSEELWVQMVGENALSYRGDDYCDDGGCQTGSGPDIRVDTIEFL